MSLHIGSRRRTLRYVAQEHSPFKDALRSGTDLHIALYRWKMENLDAPSVIEYSSIGEIETIVHHPMFDKSLIKLVFDTLALRAPEWAFQGTLEQTAEHMFNVSSFSSELMAWIILDEDTATIFSNI